MKFNMLKFAALAAILLSAVFAAVEDRVPRRKKFDASLFLQAGVVNVEEAPVVPRKRLLFNAAAFLAPALAPVKVEAEKPAPGKRVPFNAAAFLASAAPVLAPGGPLVEKKAPGKRTLFNAADFLKVVEKLKQMVYIPPENVVPPALGFALDPAIIGLIDAIQAPAIRVLGANLRAVTNLAQRDAIRAFVAAMPAALPPASKEAHMNALIARKINQIIPLQVQAITPVIRALIDAISIVPVVTKRNDTFLDNNISIGDCKRAIANLPDIERDVHYQALIARIRSMVPTFDIALNESESDADLRGRTEGIICAFRIAHEKLINDTIRSRIAAITPGDEPLDPAPVVADPVGAADLAIPLAAGGAVTDEHNVAFDTRLKKFLIEHWSTYYKPKRVAINTVPVEALLQQKFNVINASAATIVNKKIQKTAIIESILLRMFEQHNPHVRDAIREMGLDADVPDPEGRHPDLFQDSPQFQAFLLNDYTYIKSLENAARVVPPENHVYTNMEKIKDLPSTNWDETLENHVFNVRVGWRKQLGETDAVYWVRIGNEIIDIYNDRIKPHVYPDNLAVSLLNGVQVPLIPFRAMFSDAGDANYADNGNIFAYEVNAAQDPLRAGHENPGFNLEAERAVKAQAELAFRGQVARSYKKVHDYTMKSLGQLFGTAHPIEDGLNWDWFGAGADFTPERLELCKKVMLIFSHLGRVDWDPADLSPAGLNRAELGRAAVYANDFFDIATLMARFTHCTDGKKTAIEATSTRALAALGVDGGALVAEDFDTFIKKIVLNNFKSNAITALASHEHAENVSIIANIKFRHQAFWNVPCAIVAQFPHYFDTDYYLGNDGKTDNLLQYFYQHIYVGPHELVNAIYNYLSAEDVPVEAEEGAAPVVGAEAAAKKVYRKAQAIVKRRAGFLGLAGTMLDQLRPFEDLLDGGVDTMALLKDRHCELIPTKPEVKAAARVLHSPDPIPNYLLTRKGIEMILFYAGYLAWNDLGADGNPHGHPHPLVADWNDNLAWLPAAKYAEIYG